MKIEFKNPFKKEYYADYTLLSVSWNLSTLIFSGIRFEKLVCYTSGFSLCFRKELFLYSARGNDLRITILGFHVKMFGNYISKALKYLPTGEYYSLFGNKLK